MDDPTLAELMVELAWSQEASEIPFHHMRDVLTVVYEVLGYRVTKAAQ